MSNNENSTRNENAFEQKAEFNPSYGQTLLKSYDRNASRWQTSIKAKFRPSLCKNIGPQTFLDNQSDCISMHTGLHAGSKKLEQDKLGGFDESQSQSNPIASLKYGATKAIPGCLHYRACLGSTFWGLTHTSPMRRNTDSGECLNSFALLIFIEHPIPLLCVRVHLNVCVFVCVRFILHCNPKNCMDVICTVF